MSTPVKVLALSEAGKQGSWTEALEPSPARVRASNLVAKLAQVHADMESHNASHDKSFRGRAAQLGARVDELAARQEERFKEEKQQLSAVHAGLVAERAAYEALDKRVTAETKHAEAGVLDGVAKEKEERKSLESRCLRAMDERLAAIRAQLADEATAGAGASEHLLARVAAEATTMHDNLAQQRRQSEDTFEAAVRSLGDKLAELDDTLTNHSKGRQQLELRLQGAVSEARQDMKQKLAAARADREHVHDKMLQVLEEACSNSQKSLAHLHLE